MTTMEPTMDTCLSGLRDRGFLADHIFDVGAADGTWSRRAREFWPEASSILFEPLTEREAELNSLAQILPNTVWHKCGLGRERTMLDISLSSNLFISSFAYTGDSSRRVQVETLDHLLTEGRIPRGNFMKIDVQGFELEVIAGASQFLSSVDVVVMETYFHRFAPRMSLIHETIHTMCEQGFRVYELMDQCRRPYDNAVGQCDICFVRKKHKLFSVTRWN